MLDTATFRYPQCRPPALLRSRNCTLALLFRTGGEQKLPTSISRMSLAALLKRFWRFNCRARAVDHPLYESNRGLWRWVTGGCGHPVSFGRVNRRFPGIGKPWPPPFLIRADSEALIEFHLVHVCFTSVAWCFQPIPPAGATLEILSQAGANR